MKTFAVCCGIALILSGPATAQRSDWTFDATIYLFMPETSTSISTPARTVEGSLSFSDALSNLDFSFMGAIAANNGRWTLLLDYMYTDLSFGQTSPDPAFGALNTEMTTQILNGYAAYRVYETPTSKVDLAAGFRWFDTQTVLTLTPGTSPGTSARADDNWIDPLVGVRAQVDFSDKWSGTAFFDYGGFSSDSETWQALLTANYAINDKWFIRGGYRYISVDHVINGNDFHFSQSGPILGASYRF